jgi:hypothetical protein
MLVVWDIFDLDDGDYPVIASVVGYDKQNNLGNNESNNNYVFRLFEGASFDLNLRSFTSRNKDSSILLSPNKT